MQNKFFGSKLNTVLLVVLIVVMIIALKLMRENKEMYENAWQGKGPNTHTQIKSNMEGPDYTPPHVEGRAEDLVSFSILPGARVHGVVSYRGTVQGGYFFEANIGINILDANKKLLKASNAMTKEEWTTGGPIDFEGNIDFTGLKKGPAYFEIHNDNASGLPENDKSILIPIVIE